jgi:hypothetical protein
MGGGCQFGDIDIGRIPEYFVLDPVVVYNKIKADELKYNKNQVKAVF